MKTSCPFCGREEDQVKAGLNGGNQRYKCGFCRRRYTPSLRERGYSHTLRQEALSLLGEGVSAREIGRRLGIHYRTVANWAAQNKNRSSVPDPAEAPASAGEPAGSMGKRRPTIHDVAKQARVSVSTISNYLNNKGRMSQATSSRIQAAIETLHFTPSFLVRAIRQNRTRIIGVVIFGLGSLDERPGTSLTPPILTGIDIAAQAASQDVLLYTDWSGPQGSISADRFLGGHIDGLVWVAPQMHEPVLEKV